jgi:RNA polymerase sigma factor (sigma-70 family)
VRANIRGMLFLGERRYDNVISKEDQAAAALAGIDNALRTYDPSRGTTFRTHVINEIRIAVLKEIEANNPVSSHYQYQLGKIHAAEQALWNENSREPTHAETAAKLMSDGVRAGAKIAWSEQDVSNALSIEHSARVIAIDTITHWSREDERLQVEDILASPSADADMEAVLTGAAYGTWRHEVISEAIDRLKTVPERRAMRAFFEGMLENPNITQTAVAQKLGVTREAVRQALNRGYRQLREDRAIAALHDRLD